MQRINTITVWIMVNAGCIGYAHAAIMSVPDMPMILLQGALCVVSALPDGSLARHLVGCGTRRRRERASDSTDLCEVAPRHT